MSHAAKNCPHYPRTKPKEFHHDRMGWSREYRGMCRDCGSEWDMIVQDGKKFLKKEVMK